MLLKFLQVRTSFPKQQPLLGMAWELYVSMGKIEDRTGQRLAIDQKILKYFDNALFSSSIAVRKEGEPFERDSKTGAPVMGGSCFGDSGGGAFVKAAAGDSESEWYLAGVAGNINGFLAPGDPQNPSSLSSCYNPNSTLWSKSL